MAYPGGGGRGVHSKGNRVAVKVRASNGGSAHQPLHAAQLARAAAAPVVLRKTGQTLSGITSWVDCLLPTTNYRLLTTYHSTCESGSDSQWSSCSAL